MSSANRMVNPLRIFDFIYKLSVSWFRWQGSKRDRAKAFILEAIATNEKLIEVQDINSDKAKYLHSRLKVLYDSGSQIVGTMISPDDIHALKNALCYGRVYFRLRECEARATTPSIITTSVFRDLDDLMADSWEKGTGPDSLPEFASARVARSLTIQTLRPGEETWVHPLQDGHKPMTSTELAKALSSAKTICLENIAQLKRIGLVH